MSDWFINNPIKATIVIFLFGLIISIVSWLVKSKMEAEAFSRITGEQITTWDAMWVELRVDRPVVNSGS